MKKKFIILLIYYSLSFGQDNTILISDNQTSGSAPAAPPSVTTSQAAKGPKYIFIFNGEPLSRALTSFANNNGLKIIISKKLSKKVSANNVRGKFSAQTAAGFLDSMSRQYGFDWFIFSGGLYITSQEQITSYIDVSTDNMPEVRLYLDNLGLLDPKFGYTELSSQGKIAITGPEDYVNVIIKQVRQLKLLVPNQQYAVFRLKYANAVDTQLTFNNQQITIPGVATILQNLNVGKSYSSTKKVSPQVEELLSNKLIESNSASNRGSPTDSNDDKKTLVSTAQIEADARLNTIIIRDNANNLKMYRNIIQELDVPSPIIQIEVMIVRLDQDKLAEKGIDWWASNKSYSTGFGAANLNGINNSLSLSYNQINPGQLIVTNMGSFASNLQFLENEQYAKTEAKPSLATIDNLPASISLTDNIYSTNIASAQNAQANTNINNNNTNIGLAGVQLIQALQITPHVIAGKNGVKNKIKLTVSLQDGAINEFSNPQMPNYYQSTLNSQAVISEGQSLILAGYTKNTTVKTVTQVPVLGDIPLLGWFFKSSVSQVHKITTLYVVTPKIVYDN